MALVRRPGVVPQCCAPSEALGVSHGCAHCHIACSAWRARCIWTPPRSCRIAHTLFGRVSSSVYLKEWCGVGQEENQTTLFCRKTVRALLSHSDSDPAHFLRRTIQSSAKAGKARTGKTGVGWRGPCVNDLGYGYGRAFQPAQARLHPIPIPRSYRKIASNSSKLRWTWVSPSTRGTDRMRSASSTTP